MSHIPPTVSDSPVLKLLNVESAYGPIKAIRGISLQVRRGEIATVLGANGAGKTTILKTISGIIDPRTGQPAATDVVQATVLAGTAREAEAFAKTAVILGAAAGLAYLDRIGALGAVVLTARGESFALPQTSLWLAA